MKKLSEQEKQLFLKIGLPGVQATAPQDSLGRVMYCLRNNFSIDEIDLAAVFRNDYYELLDLVQEKGILFDSKNYVYEFFFRQHNETAKTRVLLGQITGFKFERRGEKTFMAARVKYYDGSVLESKLEVSPFMRISDFMLNDFVIIHNNMVCLKLLESEYRQVLRDYFNVV